MSLLSLICGVGACATLGLSALAIRTQASRAARGLLCAILGLLTALLVEVVLADSGAYRQAPMLFGWSYPALSLLGPLLGFYVSTLAPEPAPAWQSPRLHLACAGAALLALGPWVMAGGETRMAIDAGTVSGPFARSAELGLIVYLLACIAIIGVSLAAGWMRLAAAPNTAVPRRFLAVAALAWAILSGQILASVAGLANDFTVAFCGLALTIALSGVLISRFFLQPSEAASPDDAAGASSEKYAKSLVPEVEMQAILRRIEQAVAQGLIHHDSGLNLAKLAAAIRVKPNKVSQALNKHEGGFHRWLAKTRAYDAMGRLANGDADGLLDVAYLVGFNSKSTFYQAFKREFGMTPGAWLKARGVEPPPGDVAFAANDMDAKPGRTASVFATRN